jgi:class 3 adenylate cyclase/predicted ATPase
MDLGGWLRSLGLERYEAAFRENAIDDTVLLSLTAEDLKDLGVGVVGHRRRLLDAIAALRADTRSKAPPDAVPAADRTTKDSAERRQVTVMFCDLVGSTALSARMDPEDLRDVISAYQTCLAETVRHFGGFLAKYLGDGVLVYFGYPQAHEDDAEQAVRAGLALVEAIAKLDVGQATALRVRIGIATGLVVVGDLLGEGAAQEQAVVGETPNVAARLQALAEPGQVVISQGTQRLTAGLFDYQDLGRVTLKGLVEPVQAWQVTGASAVRSRFEAQHATNLTPLVGREEELELLLRCWRQAANGEGRVVLLSGEPGIGKSRLTVALQERLQAGPHTRMRYFCSPHHTDSALYPTIAQLERAAGFERDDTPEAKLDKITSLLGPSSEHENDIQLLAELLSIPTGARYAPLNWSPQRKKEKTLDALLRQLQMLSRQRPVLVVYEDVHWIDPSSHELLDMIVGRAASLPVLLIITFRPEFAPPWIGQAGVSTLSLSRLGRREGAALVEQVAGGNPLPDDITAEIVERTDGIPLFVEELTKAVLEAAAHEGDAKPVVSAAPVPTLAVPATLHASLMARLDRLGTNVREVAQIGAVIGREFSFELLAAVAGRGGQELRAALDRLTDAGLVFCRGTPPEATFLFKHALVQDAAYATLLRSARKRLHRRIAELLEERFPNKAQFEPELLARHYTHADLTEAATAYWQKAAVHALQRSANLEAVRHIDQGLGLLRTLPETRKRYEQELKFEIALAQALRVTRGYGATETLQACTRAHELVDKVGTVLERMAVMYGLFAVHYVRSELPRAYELADLCLRLAKSQSDPGYSILGHRIVGTTLWALGDLLGGKDHLERAIDLYEPARDRKDVFRFAHDHRVTALAFLALDLWCLGYPQDALRANASAVEQAHAIGDASSLAIALSFGALLNTILRRDLARAEGQLAEALPLYREHGFPMYAAWATSLQGSIAAQRGQAGAAVESIASGMAASERTGTGIFQPLLRAELARALADAGQSDAALGAVSDALRLADTTKEKFAEPELHRVKGDVFLARPRPLAADAEASYKAAIDVARRQSGKGWELRAATSLARLWRDQGQRQQAHDLLAPVYGWFTEGFDTHDLRGAKALLEELAP